jgi:hypothetical protein
MNFYLYLCPSVLGAITSTSQNSAGNKENPSVKMKMVQNDNTSLKRLIMFESYKNESWETEQIQNHKDEIEKLIEKYVMPNRNHIPPINRASCGA